MVNTRQAHPSELGRVEEMYRETGYGGGVSPDDEVLVAEYGTKLVGAVRFCKGYGVVILRGMRVREGFQRQGIGTCLLVAGETLLGNRTCYCLSYHHLRDFYGQAGFVEIPPAGAPQGLQNRLADYQARGLDVIILRRECVPHWIANNFEETGQ
jgi:GNAT superfamily N-acetyltransferase